MFFLFSRKGKRKFDNLNGTWIDDRMNFKKEKWNFLVIKNNISILLFDDDNNNNNNYSYNRLSNVVHEAVLLIYGDTLWSCQGDT